MALVFTGIRRDEVLMSRKARISVTVADTTRDQLDRFTVSRGLKKNYVVEQALWSFMEACRELPHEAFTPSRIVLEDAEFDRLAKSLQRPGV